MPLWDSFRSAGTPVRLPMGVEFEAIKRYESIVNTSYNGFQLDLGPITGHCVSVYRALDPHSDQRWPSLPRQLCQSLCLVSAHFSGNVRGIPPAKDSPAFLPASKS